MKPLVPCNAENTSYIDAIDVWWICYKNGFQNYRNRNSDYNVEVRKSLFNPSEIRSRSTSTIKGEKIFDFPSNSSTLLRSSAASFSSTYLPSSFSLHPPVKTPFLASISGESINCLSETKKKKKGNVWFIGADSVDFYNSQMFRDFNDISIFSSDDICVFDLDTMTVRIITHYIKLYGRLVYHILLYRIVSYRIISYFVILYHVILHSIASYYITLYHIMSCHVILYHIIAYRIASYHIIPYHIPYCMIFHFISLYGLQFI